MSDSKNYETDEEYRDAILITLYQSEKPFLNIREIADVMGVNQSTLPKYLGYLMGEGKYLNMYMSGRAKNYMLTDEGKAKAQELLAKKSES